MGAESRRCDPPHLELVDDADNLSAEASCKKVIVLVLWIRPEVCDTDLVRKPFYDDE